MSRHGTRKPGPRNARMECHCCGAPVERNMRYCHDCWREIQRAGGVPVRVTVRPGGGRIIRRGMCCALAPTPLFGELRKEG